MASTPKQGSSKDRLRVRLHFEEVEQPLERGEHPSRADDGNSSAASSHSDSRIGDEEAPQSDGPPDHDFLDVVTRLVEMVERGRASLLEAEEARRNAELRAAGFRGEIMLEREIRRRTEAELQELKAMVEGRRQAASERFDRVASEDASPAHEPGVRVTGRHAVQSSVVTSPSLDPDGRPLTVLGIQKADDASAPSAVTPPPFDPDGRPLTVPGGEQKDDAIEPSAVTPPPFDPDGRPLIVPEVQKAGDEVAPSAVTRPPFDPDGRPLTVPGGKQADDASESSAVTPPPFDPDGRPLTVPEVHVADDANARGTEARNMGARATETDDASARGNESDDADADAKQSGAAVSSTLIHFEADGEAAAEEEPPLPPGWRYATDAPPPKKRWWGKAD